ncbi:MAG TPA: HAMP domain-containing sensor histidine kinase [Cyclobacteriaceae bacterium]|nr:HAMP domain-containing sensor histidine kinase [Cyclobacteriaceae bacterium]
MISIGAFFLASLLLLVIILQVRAYYILKRQNSIITKQSIEIQKQNEALARQNQQLNDLNIEKQQIIGVVSHDLKGPFNRIFAIMQLMSMSGDNLTDDQKEYVGKIHQIAVDGLNMVRNLLDSRQIDEKILDLTLEPIELKPFVSSFVKNFRSVADRKKINLHFKGPDGVVVMADRLYLSRILDNLLSNAIKFSEKEKNVTVSIENSGEQVLLTVTDEGPGISEEDQKKLYLKFQKLTARPTGGESSTGLGLSIVKTLIEKMGGSISCKSQLDKGAAFTISLKKDS